MKKRTIKKLNLKESVKIALVIFGMYAIFVGALLIQADRVEKIENNPDAYTESGHAHAVEVNFTR